MLLTNSQTIREIILFPLLRPEAEGRGGLGTVPTIPTTGRTIGLRLGLWEEPPKRPDDRVCRLRSRHGLYYSPKCLAERLLRLISHLQVYLLAYPYADCGNWRRSGRYGRRHCS